jgi:EAL and modified HD-GYP domain-containing signal transduction protein
VSDYVFVARQPILDRQRQTFAYELLFRSSSRAGVASASDDAATADGITNSVLSIGLDALTDGRWAFINVTRGLLLAGVPWVLPASRVVVELLGNIEADPDVMAACRELRSAGYAIALDDFVPTEGNAPLVELADFVKIDLLQPSGPAAMASIADMARNGRPSLLAEKVETVEMFNRAMGDGYKYFQGFFFGRPKMQHGRAVRANQLAYIRLMRALNEPDITMSKLEELIKHDTSLCFRALQTVNSAGFGLRTTVDSIRDALMLLGCDTVRRWASVLALAGLGGRDQTELIVMSTVRARFCELIGERSGGADRAAEGFLLGMCSTLDALLECPMETIVAQLPVSIETRAALLGERNSHRDLIDCAITYERGEWDRSVELAGLLNVSPECLAKDYVDALKWARELTKGAASPSASSGDIVTPSAAKA